MRTTGDLNQYGLDSLELKALSVPSSLRFLLGIEYDVVLCVNEVGVRRPFRIHFPVFAPTFRKLLSLCATRFGLDCAHSKTESVLSGTAVMPLLRYADFLPGALHVKEILECLQVEPAAKAKRWHSTTTAASSSLEAGAAAASAANSEDSAAANGNGTASANEFEASFIDYAEFASDSSLEDVHGLGFYLMLDYGLSLATHSHLVGIRFHKDWDAKEALREFQDFSGWEAFDLRFLDEQRRQDGGVIVMPSSQDACDLLEKYEDEDSDDEGDLLPFILRPVSPLVSVPSLEDSALRKLRDQHWAEVERHWAHLPHTMNTVVVYNLYDGATLREILTFFDTLPIVASEFVEDDAPTHRRRAFLTFANLEATRKALDVDGKNTRGCTLRVQVSPPYISTSRRGHEVKPERPAAVSATATGSSPKLTASHPNGSSTNGKTGGASTSPSTSPATRAVDHAAAAAKPSSGGAAAEKTQPQPRVASAAPASTAAATQVNVPTSAARPATAAAGSAAAAPPPPQPSSTAAPPSFSASRPVNASAAIASAIAARAHAATAVPSTTDAPHAAAYASSAPIALPKATNAAASAAAGNNGDHETSLSVGSASSSHGPTHMNASAKEFVPQFQLSATSPEYHPSPAPKPDMLYGFNGALQDGPGGPGSMLPPPLPPPAYGNALSPPADYRPTPRSTQLMHGGVPVNLPAYALPPPYLPGEEHRDDAVPPPPLPPPY